MFFYFIYVCVSILMSPLHTFPSIYAGGGQAHHSVTYKNAVCVKWGLSLLTLWGRRELAVRATPLYQTALSPLSPLSPLLLCTLCCCFHLLSWVSLFIKRCNSFQELESGTLCVWEEEGGRTGRVLGLMDGGLQGQRHRPMLWYKYFVIDGPLNVWRRHVVNDYLQIARNLLIFIIT